MGGGQDATVLDIFREGLREVKEAVKDVNASINQLRGETVNRREFDRYRDETTIDLQQAQTKHDRDIAEIKADAQMRAAQATSFRRWLIGLGSATAVGISGIVATILTHFH